MFFNIFNFPWRKAEIKPQPVPYHSVPWYIVWNVDNFNTWFNAENNGAIYVHKGIFKRTSKLTVHHVEEYLHICYGITMKIYNDNSPIVQFGTRIFLFLEDIKANWNKKNKEK